MTTDNYGIQPTVPIPTALELDLNRKGITAATDDDFLRGFNEGYEQEQTPQPKPALPAAEQTTKPYVWKGSQKELRDKGITATTMDFNYWDPSPVLQDHLQSVPAKRKLEPVSQTFVDVRKLAPVHDDFLEGFNADDLAYLKRKGPRTSYTGAWEAVQADTAGSGYQIRARAEEPTPQTYEEYLAAYEKTQAYLDELLRERRHRILADRANTIQLPASASDTRS